MVYLINYEGTDFPSISEVPLVSSQYKGRVERNAYNRLISVFSPTSGRRNFSFILKLHLCPRSCKCEAQIYLRPPTQVNSSLVATINLRTGKDPKLYVPQTYFRMEYSNGGLYDICSLTYSRVSYHILITKGGKENSFLWEFAMSGIVLMYPNTRLLKVTEEDRRMFWGERSFGLGAIVRAFSEVELVTGMRELEKSYRNINLGGGQASKWVVKLGYYFVVQKVDLFLQRTDDFSLFQRVLGNLTLIQPPKSCHKEDLDPFSCDLRLTVPTVNLKESNGLNFIRSRDKLTFLSCGRTSSREISFMGFVSAFDGITWALTLSSYVGLRVLISIWVSFRVGAKVLLIRMAIVFVSSVDILLEQGDNTLSGNSKQKKSLWLYLVTSGLLLVGVVLSNLYRGENISELSAPHPIKPLISFTDLLKFNYTIYSKIDGNTEESLFRELSEHQVLYNSSAINKYTEFYSYFYGFDRNVHPMRGNSKLMEIIRNRTRFDPDETLQLARGITGNYSFEATLLKCQDVSIIGWEAKGLESLADKVKAKFVGRGNEILSPGKEPLFMSYDGWSLTGWIDSNIFGRIQRGLVDSGVSDESLRRWRRPKYTKRNRTNESTSTFSDSEGYIRMGLKGNTVSIFWVWGFGLTTGIGILFVEAVSSMDIRAFCTRFGRFISSHKSRFCR
jgi:hypothetical protein